MTYIEALRKTSKKLDAEFESSESINHSASKGTIRETIIKSCIRPFLPEAYGISSGECFDTNGKMSKQLDAVIYDKLYSYVVPYTDDYIQFPFESVYGNIEIKSYLNKEEFEKSIANIASFKSLSRTPPTAAQVTPNRSISIKGIHWENMISEPFGIVFAFDSVSPETVIDYLRKIHTDSISYLPNMFVLYQKKTIIFRIKYYENDKLYPNFYGDFDGYMTLPCNEDTLPIFILCILIHSSAERITAMSISDILNPLVDNALHCMPKQQVARYK